MNSASTVTANSIMLPTAPRLTTMSFMAKADIMTCWPRRTDPARTSRCSGTKSPLRTDSTAGAALSAGMSVRKPSRPRFTPTSGTPFSAMRRALAMRVPSPPTTMARSAFAGSDAISTTESGCACATDAVRGSMMIFTPLLRRTAEISSRIWGRLAASLLPTIATFRNAGVMGAIKA